MLNTIRHKVIDFIDNKTQIPIITALASGLFPLTFYYYRNFTLINSWNQFLYFIFYFLLLPILIFKLADLLCNRFIIFKPIKKYVLPLLNFSWSIYLLIYITVGFSTKIIVIALILVLVATCLFSQYINKVVVFQLLLACVIFAFFLFHFSFAFKNPDTWLIQNDKIEEVMFKKKPNIYFIQPDGYANSSELPVGYYNFDNKEFENYLSIKDFKIYTDYRSNYYSTLSSNSSLFGMKHHYYNNPSDRISELYNARDVIVGENPVLSILKNNNYKTNLLLETSYLLKNRPKIAYDYCNIKLSELPFFIKNLEESKRDIFLELKEKMNSSKSTNNFYFIEKLSPGHVTNKKKPGNIANIQRDSYLEKLQNTNKWLKEVVDYIIANDKNSLIIIAADHGGFVGMNTTLEAREKQEDRDLVYSIFTAQLAIKWPEAQINFDNKIKTPVNLFRILFSYLSESEKLLDNLQKDHSYIQILEGAPTGVYEYIDEEGEVTFKEYN